MPYNLRKSSKKSRETEFSDRVEWVGAETGKYMGRSQATPRASRAIPCDCLEQTPHRADALCASQSEHL